MGRLPAGAQSASELHDIPPLRYGSIVLDNGTVIKGLLRFYDKQRIAAVDKDGNADFLSPAEVERFEFFDPALGTRIFNSIPYKEYKTSPEQYYFFEVLLEEESFAVLFALDRLRHHPGESFMDQIPSIHAGPAPGLNTVTRGPQRNVTKTYTETIYFLDDSGNFALYLVVRYEYIKRAFRERTKVTIEKKDHQLLRKYFGQHYKSLKAYAKRNNLDPETRKGLMKIFAEYRRLEGKFQEAIES